MQSTPALRSARCHRHVCGLVLRGGRALAQECDSGHRVEEYEGHVDHLQSSTVTLSKKLCKSHMVSYSFTATKTSGIGSNATIQFYSSTKAGPHDFLFQANVIAMPSGTASLPVGHGHLSPYRVTLGITARPDHFVVTSNTGPVDFTVQTLVIDRNQPCDPVFPFVPCIPDLPSVEYNTGGLTLPDATEIELGETVHGNVHIREGNPQIGGGQWYKFTMQPGQAVSTSGTILGGPIWGTNFGMQLWSATGSQIGTLGTQMAVNGEFEFPMEATFNYINTYTHTGASPETVYLQVFAQAGITHEFAIQVREVMMKFSIHSQTIDPTNNYSEDTLVKVESVWGPNGEPLVEFSRNPIYIRELTDPPIYRENGGTLPAGFFLSRGKGEFVARSLAGPVGLSGPPPAEIHVASFRTFGSDPSLVIKQWWVPASKIDPLAGSDVPGWVQARVRGLRKIYVDYRASSAFQSLSNYSVYYEAGSDGKCDWDWAEHNPVFLNIYGDPKMRLDRDYPITACLISGKNIGRLTGTFLHESRHCYQMNQGRKKVSGVINDEDGDFLVKEEYSPTSNGIMLDSSTPRNVCDVAANNVYLRSFSGDSIDDGDVVKAAYEYDAYLFEEDYADDM